MKTTGLVGGMSWSGLSGASGERVSPWQPWVSDSPSPQIKLTE